MRRSSPSSLLLALALCCGACATPPDHTVGSGTDGALPADATRPDTSSDGSSVPAPRPLASVTLGKGTYVVLAQDDLAEVAQKLAIYRKEQGYTTQVHRVSDLVGGSAEPGTLVLAVHRLLARALVQGPVFLVLVGDAPGQAEEPTGRIPALPCENLYGGCWTDNAYADIDADGLPDVAVGRIPARSPEQVLSYLAKLRAHEGTYEPGEWNRRVSLYTGQGGYGSQRDALLEMGMMEGLKRVDHAFDIVGAYNNSVSPYYYKPFTEKVVDLFNQGNLFVIYVGHGLAFWTSGLTTSELEAIHCAHRLPGVFFIACYTGDYVGPEDSVAEAILKKDDGAVVVFAASNISHPYGNGALLYELTRVLFGQRPATYGEGLRQAKRGLVEHTDEFRQLLDAFALVEVPAAEQPLIRAEHVNLYNLLGDPAAAIAYPRTTISFDPVKGSLKDGKLTVSGEAPGIAQGVAIVTLEVERDVMLHPLDPVDPFDPDEATIQANWSKAVDKVVTSKSVLVSGSVFSAELTWTPPLPGSAFYVKVYAKSATADSFGAVQVQ